MAERNVPLGIEPISRAVRPAVSHLAGQSLNAAWLDGFPANADDSRNSAHDYDIVAIGEGGPLRPR